MSHPRDESSEQKPSIVNHSNTIKPFSESYNFHYTGSLNTHEEKILKLLDSSALELTPKEIAAKTGINHNSTKVYLVNLKKRNLLIQPYRGAYTSTKNLVTLDTHPGGEVTVSPRVHNLRLRVLGVRGGGIVREFRYGFVSISAVVSENGVANVQVSCDKGYGLDYGAFKIVLACVFRELGISKDTPVKVTSYELNHDFAGVDIQGCKSLTLKAFDGSFERFYNKRRKLLRSEVRAVGPTSPEAIYQLLKGGVHSYNMLQMLALYINETRKVFDAQKFTNELLKEQQEQNKRQLRLLESVVFDLLKKKPEGS